MFPVGTKVIGAKSMEEMVASLKKPRRVMMLVKAGPAVDAFIEKLVSVERTILIINLQDELLMPHLRNCGEVA